MANLNTTRIYNDLRALLKQSVRIVDDFPKSSRWIIGRKMMELAIDMNKEYAEGYLSKGERCVELINKLLSDLSTYQLLATIAIEERWIQGQRKAANLVKLLAGLQKQATALRNSFMKKYGSGMPGSVCPQCTSVND